MQISYEKELIEKAVYKDLNQSWYKRSYDFLGILGQATGFRWIQSPWKYYCSERIAKYLCLIRPLKEKIPKRPSPADLNRLFKTLKGMEVFGYWFYD